MQTAALGLVSSPLALWVLPLVFLTGLAFGGMGLVMTSLSPSYDFFMYYFTLAVTPMMLASGVFFPVEQLPGWLQAVSHVLPLTHAVELARPLMNGAVPASAKRITAGPITRAVSRRGRRAHSSSAPRSSSQT